MSAAAFGRLCCKSRFALVIKNSADYRRGFRVKMWGTSSPHVKLTGDFGNAVEVIRIGDCFTFRVFAKNSQTCNIRLLQHNRHKADITRCLNGAPSLRIVGLYWLMSAQSRLPGMESAMAESEHELDVRPRRRVLRLVALASFCLPFAGRAALAAEGNNATEGGRCALDRLRRCDDWLAEHRSPGTYLDNRLVRGVLRLHADRSVVQDQEVPAELTRPQRAGEFASAWRIYRPKCHVPALNSAL